MINDILNMLITFYYNVYVLFLTPTESFTSEEIYGNNIDLSTYKVFCRDNLLVASDQEGYLVYKIKRDDNKIMMRSMYGFHQPIYFSSNFIKRVETIYKKYDDKKFEDEVLRGN